MVAGEAALRILSTKMIKVPDFIALVTVKLSGGSWQPLMQMLEEIETTAWAGNLKYRPIDVGSDKFTSIFLRPM